MSDQIVAKDAIDKAARAKEQADADHVEVVVAATHKLTASLLHSTSRYVEIHERGVDRIEQII